MSFNAARWLPNRHLMTIYGALGRRPRGLPLRRERWELPDGDFLDIDRLAGPRPDAPLLVVCHGMEGSSDAGYVRGLLAEARDLGLAGLALNFRGCSGEPNRLARFYHSGETEDLAYVISRVIAEQPGRPLVIAGFSLGGNVTAKYLGELGDAVPAEVRAAAVVSVPFDLAACCRALDGPGLGAFIYRRRFLKQLKRKALAKAVHYPERFDVARVRAARTLHAFDDAVTAPLHGFADAEDYYARSSSGPLLPSVRRRLLIVVADDDPFIPAASLPLLAARGNPLITLDHFPYGGHVAFVGGPPWRPRWWAEGRVAGFLASHASAR